MSVDSSPIGKPVLSTIARRSASGSVAKPMSAFSSRTFFDKSLRCAGIGSVPLGKSPVFLQYILTTSQFNFSRNSGRIL